MLVVSRAAHSRFTSMKQPMRLLSVAFTLLSLNTACVAPASAFGFGDVMQLAGELAARPYKPPDVAMPDELRKLTHDQHSAIAYKPERSLWHDARTRFAVTFVHMGMVFDQPVAINELSSDGRRRLRFDPDQFDYGGANLKSVGQRGLGYAGLRVHYAADALKPKDEILVFLGASYFRAVGRNLRYGLAARGLAIDTGEASGEEFPRFVEFWISRPSPSDQQLVIFALLDSRRVTGAYRFVIKPGAGTVMDVQARLFLRSKVAKLGIAPLTSMYLHGENQPPPPGSARPEVHTSDGLSIQATANEWIWRPLVNPRRLLITSFGLNGPLGFGLMQRDTAFRSYEDLDARFDLRPSAFIVPQGSWGAGRVELVQIPSPSETNDNIVAYWVPSEQPQVRKPFDIEYRLIWAEDANVPQPRVRVAQSRRIQTPPAVRKDKTTDSGARFLIDFEAAPSAKALLPTDVQWVVSAGDNGEILERAVRRNDASGGWRATLRVRVVDEKKPVELRGQLNAGGTPLSEVWSYIIAPE